MKNAKNTESYAPLTIEMFKKDDVVIISKTEHRVVRVTKTKMALESARRKGIQHLKWIDPTLWEQTETRTVGVDELMVIAKIKKGRSYLRKPLTQYTLSGEVVNQFDSINQAAKELGVQSGHLSSALNGRVQTLKGFIFKFDSDEDVHEINGVQKFRAFDEMSVEDAEEPQEEQVPLDEMQ